MRLCGRKSYDEVLKMDGAQILILQGLAGDPDTWVQRINESLTRFRVLLRGSIIKNAYVFYHENRQCFVFDLRGVNYNFDRLEEWRILSYPNYEGVWLGMYKNMN